MKKIFTTLVGLFLIISVNAQQQTAEFETTIYVMDLNGNMDSVIIGYDSTATSFFGLDAQFGEVDISNQLWDSILEVRAIIDYNSSQVFNTKRTINQKDCENPFGAGAGGAVLSIYSKTPVVISWNMQDFQDNCIDSSVVVEDEVFFNNPYIPYYRESYMANRPNHGATFDIPNYNYSYYQGNIEGGGTDTIRIVYIGLIDDMDVFSNTNKQKQIQQKTKAFPNPTSDKFTIQLPENYHSESVQIFDITGREIYQNTEQNNQIEVPSSVWAKGVYFYQVELEDGLFVNGKIIKN
jgi:hypothetical protein